uniref:Uncharacterized protein n=1 Tax=Oryza meridionalis TaxID=40149 RepID=A0A0E0DWY3_9ORYZ
MPPYGPPQHRPAAMNGHKRLSYAGRPSRWGKPRVFAGVGTELFRRGTRSTLGGVAETKSKYNCNECGSKKRMDHNDRHSSLLTKVGFGALTCNSILAIYRSQGDLASVAFVVAAYAALLLLFYFLGKFERARPEERGKVKVAVWSLTTLLTAMFTSRVAPLMPPLVAAGVWIMAAATVVGGFWAFFLHP